MVPQRCAGTGPADRLWLTIPERLRPLRWRQPAWEPLVQSPCLQPWTRPTSPAGPRPRSTRPGGGVGELLDHGHPPQAACFSGRKGPECQDTCVSPGAREREGLHVGSCSFYRAWVPPLKRPDAAPLSLAAASHPGPYLSAPHSNRTSDHSPHPPVSGSPRPGSPTPPRNPSTKGLLADSCPLRGRPGCFGVGVPGRRTSP